MIKTLESVGIQDCKSAKSPISNTNLAQNTLNLNDKQLVHLD